MALTLLLVLVNRMVDPLFPHARGMGSANGRAGEPMPGAEATVAFFAARNGCGAQHQLAEAGCETMGRCSAVTVNGHRGRPPGVPWSTLPLPAAATNGRQERSRSSSR